MAKQIMDLYTDGNYPPTTHTPRYAAGGNAFHNNLYKAPNNYNTNAGNLDTRSGQNVYGSPRATDVRGNSKPVINTVTYE